MQADPEVSVVVPTRDRHESLRRMAAAIAAQRTDRSFELIVVDDGSTPPVTEADLAGVPGGRVLRGPGRRAAGARNAGIDAARGEIVLFTDDDTEPDPGWLDAAVDFLAEHPEHVGVEGVVTSRPWDPLHAMSITADAPGTYLTGNIAFRRAVLEQLHGFDADSFPLHCEDVDLAMRALDLGPIGFEPRMQVEHHARPLSLAAATRRGRLLANETTLFRRHRQRFGRAARLPAPLFPLLSGVRYVATIGRTAGLRSPRRIARFSAFAVGYMANVLLGMLGRQDRPVPTRHALKVLFVMPFAHRHGGAENILWTYLRLVDRRRVEPAVVFFEEGPFRGEVAALGISTHVLRPADCPRPRIALFPPRLARIVRRERPDVLFSWLVEAQAFASLAGVLTARARRVAWWQANLPRLTFGERLATALPTRAVFLYSHATAAVQRRIRPRRRTVVVHPGIEAPPPLEPAARDRMRAELELPAERPVIGIVGRLMTWKGQHHVLRALALLRERGHEVHGLIVGGNAYDHEPEYEPELHRLTGELGLDGHVTFTGQVPDATAYMQVMDVTVNASDHEPFGIVVLEAMAQEVPVVAVDAGGPAEILENGVSGLLVPAATPEHFADAFERLVTDRELRDRIARGGRARYEDRFTVGRMVEEITAGLESLV